MTRLAVVPLAAWVTALALVATTLTIALVATPALAFLFAVLVIVGGCIGLSGAYPSLLRRRGQG